MAGSKNLRAVAEGERREALPSLTEAVASGDVLDMLLAQRRLIADALVKASDNTRPQLNNELNKLHALIAAEEERRGTAEGKGSRALTGPEPFDASAV